MATSPSKASRSRERLSSLAKDGLHVVQTGRKSPPLFHRGRGSDSAVGSHRQSRRGRKGDLSSGGALGTENSIDGRSSSSKMHTGKGGTNHNGIAHTGLEDIDGEGLFRFSSKSDLQIMMPSLVFSFVKQGGGSSGSNSKDSSASTSSSSSSFSSVVGAGSSSSSFTAPAGNGSSGGTDNSAAYKEREWRQMQHAYLRAQEHKQHARARPFFAAETSKPMIFRPHYLPSSIPQPVDASSAAVPPLPTSVVNVDPEHEAFMASLTASTSSASLLTSRARIGIINTTAGSASANNPSQLTHLVDNSVPHGQSSSSSFGDDVLRSLDTSLLNAKSVAELHSDRQRRLGMGMGMGGLGSGASAMGGSASSNTLHEGRGHVTARARAGGVGVGVGAGGRLEEERLLRQRMQKEAAAIVRSIERDAWEAATVRLQKEDAVEHAREAAQALTDAEVSMQEAANLSMALEAEDNLRRHRENTVLRVDEAHARLAAELAQERRENIQVMIAGGAGGHHRGGYVVAAAAAAAGGGNERNTHGSNSNMNLNNSSSGSGSSSSSSSNPNPWNGPRRIAPMDQRTALMLGGTKVRLQ